MNFGSASTNQQLTGTINFFRNPYSKTIVNVTVGYYTNCGIAPESPKTQSFITFTSGDITSITMTSNSNVIGQENLILTLTFTPTTILKPTGRIDFIVPFWYDAGSTSSNVFYMLDKTSVVSSNTAGITVSGGSLSASSGTYTFYYEIVNGNDITSTPVSFKFTNFRNPISSSPVSGFYLYTEDSEGNIIDLTTTAQSFPGVT